MGTGKTLTPAGVVSDGNGGANYNYTYAPVATGEINPANLTVTAAANTKTYDGTHQRDGDADDYRRAAFRAATPRRPGRRPTTRGTRARARP